MERFNKKEIREYFDKNGKHETLKYIFRSRKVPFLDTSVDISKTLELTSLSKGERSIVKYLKLEDTKRSNKCLYPIVKANNPSLRDCTKVYKDKKERKMSKRLMKEKESSS